MEQKSFRTRKYAHAPIHNDDDDGKCVFRGNTSRVLLPLPLTLELKLKLKLRLSFLCTFLPFTANVKVCRNANLCAKKYKYTVSFCGS